MGPEVVKYYRLGGTKQLNQIVIAGSHDAGITGGDQNEQTQDQDIYGQAIDGVRFFDLRVGAAKVGTSNGVRQGALTTYHGGGSTKKQSMQMEGSSKVKKVDRFKLSYGVFGMGLSEILDDARNFVTHATYKKEFLILKFDKSSSWELIAKACTEILDGCLYTGGGNINTKTLDDLAGKVVVLFHKKGVEAVQNKYPPTAGINGFKNLYTSKGGYQDNFDGLQYFGKGGTDLNPVTMKYGESGKIQDNVDIQSRIIRKAVDPAAVNMNVMGMMYWTSTGYFGSIEERNAKMWNKTNRNAMAAMWAQGLGDSITSRLGKHVDPTDYAAGGMLKTVIPNIVMIDFADSEKCKKIYKLNTVAGTELTKAAQIVDAELQEVQDKLAKMHKRGARPGL